MFQNELYNNTRPAFKYALKALFAIFSDQELWQLKSEDIDFKNLCRKVDGEENSDSDEDDMEEEEVDEDDEASMMMDELVDLEIDIAPITVEPSTSAVHEFSLPLITLNEESQEESQEEAEIEPTLEPVPTRNNNKRKRSLGMTGPSKLSKRICF